MRRVTYAARRDLSEWDAAIADVTKLIEQRPNDKDYPWWRAQLHEQKGELEEAARDYERAIFIEPKITNIPFHLVTVDDAEFQAGQATTDFVARKLSERELPQPAVAGEVA